MQYEKHQNIILENKIKQEISKSYDLRLINQVISTCRTTNQVFYKSHFILLLAGL